MRIVTCGFIAVILLNTISLVFSQALNFTEPSQDIIDDSTDELSLGEDVNNSDLFLRYLLEDIRTSSFYDLAIWARRIGLSTQGDRDALTRRIAGYYGLTYISSPSVQILGPGMQQELQEIVIESARESRYYSIEEIDEEYIRLIGGARLILDDTEATHTIKADEFIFNQSESNITASGNIDYIIEHNDITERFVGQSLTMNLNTWDGVFIQGTTIRPRPASSDASEAYFAYTGDFISRSSDSVVVVENGIVTSSIANPPYYTILADKIWVLSPTDWGMERAVVKIGRIPVLYFPYFFHPGDDLVFHPAIGISEREGMYIQTTTYLLGRRSSASDSGFSFLQTADTANNRKEVRGLFLHTTNEALTENELNQEGTLRLIIDIFTRLGGYVGIDANFPNIHSYINRLEFIVGAGLTQHIYEIDTNTFTNIYLNENRIPILNDAERITNDLNTSNFAGLSLPFRYVIDLTTAFTIDDINLNGNIDFELYSDSTILQDFGNRNEILDWVAIIEGRNRVSSSGAKSSLNWRLNVGWRPTLNNVKPYINRFSIDTLQFGIEWAQRAIEHDDLVEYRPSAVNANRSPDAFFFYPRSFTYPNLSLSFSGTLFDTNNLPEQVSTEVSNAAIVENIKENVEIIEREPLRSSAIEQLDFPWPTKDREDTQTDLEDSILIIPNIAGELSSTNNKSQISKNSRFSLQYQMSPELLVRSTTSNDEWRLPTDVNFELGNSSITINNNLSVDYNLNLFERILQIDGVIDLNTRYRSEFSNVDLSAEERLMLESDANDSTQIILDNDINVSSYPFTTLPILHGTNINWQFNTRLIEYEFESADNRQVFAVQAVDFTDSAITDHNIGLDLRISTLGATQSFSFSATLPPRDLRFNGRASIITGPLTTTARITATLPESAIERDIMISGQEMVREQEQNEISQWIFTPLNLSQNLKLLNSDINLSTNFVYDIEERRADILDISLKLWTFHFALNFEYEQRYEFIDEFLSRGLSGPWQRSQESTFIPLSFELRTNPSFDTGPIWKNRLNLQLSFNTRFHINLQRYTFSYFELSPRFTVSIFQFLDFSFSSTIRNDLIYQYIAPLAERVGRPALDFFTDLLDSVNIFDNDSLRKGSFKLQRINLSLTHDLVDWEFTMNYSGSPELSDFDDDGIRQYEWVSTFSFAIIWKPVPEFDSRFTIEPGTDQDMAVIKFEENT